MNMSGGKPPWRLPPELEPFRGMVKAPDGHTIESLLNRVGPVPDREIGSYIQRERDRVALHISVLIGLFNAGCLTPPREG